MDSQSTPDHSSDVPREGLGLGMGYMFGVPEDTQDWKQCSDCGVWVHGVDRESCPHCGFVFGDVGAQSGE